MPSLAAQSHRVELTATQQDVEWWASCRADVELDWSDSSSSSGTSSKKASSSKARSSVGSTGADVGSSTPKRASPPPATSPTNDSASLKSSLVAPNKPAVVSSGAVNHLPHHLRHVPADQRAEVLRAITNETDACYDDKTKYDRR